MQARLRRRWIEGVDVGRSRGYSIRLYAARPSFCDSTPWEEPQPYSSSRAKTGAKASLLDVERLPDKGTEDETAARLVHDGNSITLLWRIGKCRFKMKTGGARLEHKSWKFDCFQYFSLWHAACNRYKCRHDR